MTDKRLLATKEGAREALAALHRSRNDVPTKDDYEGLAAFLDAAIARLPSRAAAEKDRQRRKKQAV